MKLSNRQAIDAQNAIGSLLAMNLPIRASLDIALLSRAIDNQVYAFGKVRDSLVKNYKIQLSIGDKEGEVKFSTEIEGEDNEETRRLKSEALKEFSDKINELMFAEQEIEFGKIHLPENITIQPSLLKPLLPFLEIGGVNGS